MLVGYLTSGFLICVFQTMPWHQNFLGFDYEYHSGSEGTLRRFLPPDRVWLALMHRSGAYMLSNQEDERRGKESASLMERLQDLRSGRHLRAKLWRYRRTNDKGATQSIGD